MLIDHSMRISYLASLSRALFLPMLRIVCINIIICQSRKLKYEKNLGWQLSILAYVTHITIFAGFL